MNDKDDDIQIMLTLGGNPVGGQIRHFSINEAGMPLTDVIGPYVHGPEPVNVFIRHEDFGEMMLLEHDWPELSIGAAIQRLRDRGSAKPRSHTKGGPVTVDITADHKGANDV